MPPGEAALASRPSLIGNALRRLDIFLAARGFSRAGRAVPPLSSRPRFR